MVTYKWPDFAAYTKEELDYLEKRYNETTNIFMKTEYGLVLFNRMRLQHHDKKLELSKTLIALCNRYKDKFITDASDYNMYPYLLCNKLTDALTILYRSSSSLKTEFETTVKLAEDWILNWTIDTKEFPFLCRSIIQNFLAHTKDIRNIIQVDKIINKLNTAIDELSPVDTWAAISISEEAIKFSGVYKPELKTGYCSIAGSFYESVGDRVDPAGSIHEYENALVNFKSAKDNAAVERISKKMEENKGKTKLGTIAVEANEDQVTAINKFINNTLDKKSADLIVVCLSGYNIIKKSSDMYADAEAAAKSDSIMNFCTLHSIDKYSNIIRVYSTDEDRVLYHLLSHLNLSHQTGLQIIFRILMKSLDAGFFSFKIIKHAFEKTWFNTPIEWLKQGDSHKTILLNSILPGIEHFFGELDKKVKDNNYIPNFILCSDSLVLKVELTLRYFAKVIGKHTFKYIDNKGGGVITYEEKSLGDLLESLKDSLDPTDYMMIRYLVNEKGGLNIRNRIAHGLVDDDEYSPVYPLTLLMIMLRLSHYEFDKTVRVQVKEPLQ